MKKHLYLIIPFAAVLICSLLAFSSIDNKIADWFQRPLSPLKENKNVVMLNVDDTSVASIGAWPFSRNVYSNVLTVLKDVKAEAVVFDLSFLDKSMPKVDEEYVSQTLPSYVDEDFEAIDSSIDSIFDYIAGSKITTSDSESYKNSLHDVTQTVKDSLNTSISYVIKSQDEALEDSLKFFDNSYLTLTLKNGADISVEESDFLENHVALDNIEASQDHKTPDFTGVEPAIFEFMHNASRAGFVNADPDGDGYLRRLHLISKYNGKYYGQLLFVPILKHFGNPEIFVSDSQIVLKNCVFADGSTKDISIPRAEDGSVLIKYPKKVYVEYENAVPLWNVYRVSLLESNVYENLKNLQENGFFDLYDGDSPVDLYQSVTYLRDELSKGENPEEEITYETYYSYLNAFYTALESYFSDSTKNALLEAYSDDAEILEYIKDTFETCQENYRSYISSKNDIEKIAKNAIFIIGTCATSTTDYGLNQYEENYPNPGVHYAVANQLLNQDFVDDSPLWISIVIALVVCYAYCIITHRVKSTGKQIIIGLLSDVVVIAALLIFFIATKKYVGVIIPVVSLLVSFIATTVSGLLSTSKDKKFITNAFSQCLSPDVVDDIIANPSSFKLGGQNVLMTAIFTDIQKFSGFSELLTAGQLVALLNYYLTKMSDIIIDQRGTVDKYEGDAIVAFVGAPVKMEDHASRACLAAINMKKAEIEMNKQIVEIAASPKPADMDQELYEAFCIMVKNKKTIFTRIGLNSGDIVAGYMGSDLKKNYTIMGNNVNLASRLEGVNKQYHTSGILMSEATRKLLDSRFIVRSLDRVQVVNVTTPIRLYELLDIDDGNKESLKKYVELWEKAKAIFEGGDYKQSLEMFKKLSLEKPSDNVVKYYIEMLERFFINSTYPTENDDFGVAFNYENPKDMNPEWVGTAYEIKGTFKLLQK